MSKAIVAVAKAERRKLLALLKPVEKTIAQFGGTTKRRKKSAGRKATAAAKPEKAASMKDSKPAKSAKAKLTREQIKRELEKGE